MEGSPAPAPVSLAGLIKLRILALLMAMMLSSLVSSAADAASSQRLTAGPGAIRERLALLLEEPGMAGAPVSATALLERFYEERHFSPAWDMPAKLASLLDAIAASRRHGLSPRDYNRDVLLRLSDAAAFRPSARLAAELDVRATEALARLALHLHHGKIDPVALEPSWNFSGPMDGIDLVDALHAIIDAPRMQDALDGLAPDDAYYRGLMDALARYRLIVARGGWPRVPGGETLGRGMTSPRVAALRTRLEMSGDHRPAPVAADAEHFDAKLDAAVRRFQRRHGLGVDGLVGADTLAALNVSARARVDQLRINMERARWVFQDLEERFLLVNIARYRVMLIERGRVSWSTRAVVGRPFRQTPVFKARMTHLEFNPVWTVPRTILEKDLLPEIREDPGALQKKNMRLLDFDGRPVAPGSVDWATVRAAAFPYMVRQAPGPDNPLGRVKFMYPNPHDVYMHDTPLRSQFHRAGRAFSSGCIRLERPLELARILLAGTEWDAAAIERVTASGETRTVYLPRPITVLTLYGTAAPSALGVDFATDVYARDERLLAALDGRSSSPSMRSR